MVAGIKGRSELLLQTFPRNIQQEEYDAGGECSERPTYIMFLVSVVSQIQGVIKFSRTEGSTQVKECIGCLTAG